MIVKAQQLIQDPHDMRPHVVLLGAGASRAAFPAGDASGQQLPVMDDFMDIIELQPLIDEADLDIGHERNFEVIYSKLISNPRYERTVKEMERRIDIYFSALSLPNRATIYDRILVSLRPTDAIFTFNWDPFLFDAYQRNREAVPLPEIFFLHGNARIGICRDHQKWGARNGECPVCFQRFTDVPLLYPIEQKNYSDDSYIQRAWEAAKSLFNEAFTLTIFGYGAPTSDTAAVELLKLAWTGRSDRILEHIEIIDTAPQSILHDRWSAFTPTLHYSIKAAFDESRIARWPRRSCESLWYPMAQGAPCEDFPLPSTDSITELQAYAAEIARYEDTHRQNSP